MRKLVYLAASTIDGFIAATSDQDPSGTIFDIEGDHAAAAMAEYPEMIPSHVRPVLGLVDVAPRHFDTVLEGRRSYEIGLAAGVDDAYCHLRHLVFSTTLRPPSSTKVEVVASDPVTRVRELKAEAGLDIWLCGGGTLAAALREEIDELHLKVHPVVLGSGVPLFDSSRAPGESASSEPVGPDQFALRSAQPFASGVSLMIYERRS